MPNRLAAIIVIVAILCLPLVSLPAQGAPEPVHLAYVRNVSMIASDLQITDLVYSGNDEYVVIHNAGTVAIALEGYRLQSVEGDQWYTFGGQTLGRGAIVRVHSGPEAISNPPQDLLWTRGHIWLNPGDKARLYDPQGRIVASYGY